MPSRGSQSGRQAYRRKLEQSRDAMNVLIAQFEGVKSVNGDKKKTNFYHMTRAICSDYVM